jgi:hypothetical protein
MYGRDGRYRSSTFVERLEVISHLVKYVEWRIILKFTKIIVGVRVDCLRIESSD